MSVSIAFVSRPLPLEAVAVSGIGEVARRLAQRLLQLSNTDLSALRGVVGSEVLIVLGPATSLPWVDGVAYLGHDPAAPRLLLPTMLRPTVATDIFERAVLRRAPGPGPLAVLWAAVPRIVSVAEALPIDHDRLLAWA